jgi:transposase
MAQDGELCARSSGGQKKRRHSGREDWLRQVMSAEPDITLRELRDRRADRGTEISRQSINDMLHALGSRYNNNRVRGGTRMR